MPKLAHTVRRRIRHVPLGSTWERNTLRRRANLRESSRVELFAVRWCQSPCRRNLRTPILIGHTCTRTESNQEQGCSRPGQAPEPISPPLWRDDIDPLCHKSICPWLKTRHGSRLFRGLLRPDYAPGYNLGLRCVPRCLSIGVVCAASEMASVLSPAMPSSASNHQRQMTYLVAILAKSHGMCERCAFFLKVVMNTDEKLSAIANQNVIKDHNSIYRFVRLDILPFL